MPQKDLFGFFLPLFFVSSYNFRQLFQSEQLSESKLQKQNKKSKALAL